MENNSKYNFKDVSTMIEASVGIISWVFQSIYFWTNHFSLLIFRRWLNLLNSYSSHLVNILWETSQYKDINGLLYSFHLISKLLLIDVKIFILCSWFLIMLLWICQMQNNAYARLTTDRVSTLYELKYLCKYNDQNQKSDPDFI